MDGQDHGKVTTHGVSSAHSFDGNYGFNPDYAIGNKAVLFNFKWIDSPFVKGKSIHLK